MLENVSFYVSVLVGGLVISFLGTLQSLYVQKEEFQAKGAFRDFFIGAILVTFLYQLVPESVSGFGSFLTDMKLPTFSMKGGANSTPLNPEFDLQVGVPRF
jgi:hypothetical protein